MSQLGTATGGARKEVSRQVAQKPHRAELPQMERDRLVAEWCRLVGRDEVLAQVAPKVQNGRPKGGEREAARQLGLSQPDVHRAIKVASLSPEAQQAAHEVGLADNRSALLRAADEATPEDQIRVLKELSGRKKVRQIDAVSQANAILERLNNSTAQVQVMVYEALKRAFEE